MINIKITIKSINKALNRRLTDSIVTDPACLAEERKQSAIRLHKQSHSLKTKKKKTFTNSLSFLSFLNIQTDSKKERSGLEITHSPLRNRQQALLMQCQR
jgi:hypothetical protein